MAQSPQLAASGTRRMSPSPIYTQQPLSKRDKKKQQVEQRIKDIADSFARDREVHLRNQLSGINRDIHFIIRANCYANRPLEDNADEAFSDVVSAPSVGGSVDGENRAPPLGRYAQRFVDHINDAMEERDARITEIHDLFHQRTENLKLDFQFTVEAAEVEHRTLRETMRERLLAQVESKKKQLKKEKEMLDAADYSTMMNNGLTLIPPSSPGGLNMNRKTRHTRRHDYDGGVEAGEGVGSKRKRKNMIESEIPSPIPGVRRPHDIQASALWEKLDSSSSSTSAAEPKVERYFTDRELASHNKRARAEVARAWADKRSRPSLNGTSRATNGDGNQHDAGIDGHHMDEEGREEMDTDVHPSMLVAPAMDRTGSSHATRSTRALQTAAVENMTHYDPAELGVVAQQGLDEHDARRVFGAAVLEAQAQRANLKETQKDLDLPYVAGLSSAEQLSDWQYLLGTKDIPD